VSKSIGSDQVDGLLIKFILGKVDCKHIEIFRRN